MKLNITRLHIYLAFSIVVNVLFITANSRFGDGDILLSNLRQGKDDTTVATAYMIFSRGSIFLPRGHIPLREEFVISDGKTLTIFDK